MSPIHVLRHGEPAGPFSEAEIQQLLARGELTPADHAWREGMADWQPLAQVVALPTAPPPVPPALGPAPVPPALAARPESRGTPRGKRRVSPAFTMTGQNEFLEVFPDRLTITPKGGLGLQTHGSHGIREISLHLLLDIGYKLPGFSSGYLQFTLAVGAGGSAKTPTDTNTFRFLKTDENIDAAARITAYVQDRMREARAVPQSITPAGGLSEELGKLAALHEQGLLTKEEFLAAKLRILT